MTDSRMSQEFKEVLAIIRPENWLKTKSKIHTLGIEVFVQHRVLGRGRQRGLRFKRGRTANGGFPYLPKRMASWIVAESQVRAVVEAIMAVNRTGQIGDGKIFVLPLDDMISISSVESRPENVRMSERSWTVASAGPIIITASR